MNSQLGRSLLIGMVATSWCLTAAAQEGESPVETDRPSDSELQAPDGTVSAEAKTADATIRDRLRDILTSSERFQRIGVEVRDGIVFLSGETRNEAYERWATEVARKTEDVVAVISDFTITEPVLEWWEILSHLLHLAIAYALALPIAWDRERGDRSAGLRTFPLVSVAACGYMLIGIVVLDGGDAQARVMYGIITGIGFIGGGAILKEKGSVRGTATAASIWNTAAIGVAVAWRHFEIAVVLSVLNFVTLRFIADLKSHVRKNEPDEDAKEPES